MPGLHPALPASPSTQVASCVWTALPLLHPCKWNAAFKGRSIGHASTEHPWDLWVGIFKAVLLPGLYFSPRHDFRISMCPEMEKRNKSSPTTLAASSWPCSAPSTEMVFWTSLCKGTENTKIYVISTSQMTD